MNNKTKKNILWLAAGLAVIVSTLFLTVVILVKISGTHKLEVMSFTGGKIDFNIKAVGVFGSNSVIKSVNGIAYLDGYYKNIEILIDTETCGEIKSVILSDDKDVLNFDISGFENVTQDRLTIFKTTRTFDQQKSFFRKAGEIICFELRKPVFLDIILFIGVIGFLGLIFLLIKELRNYNANQIKSFSKSVLTNIEVFFLGSVFWIIIVLLLLEITLRIVGFAFKSNEAETQIVNDDGKLVVLCIGDSFTYGVGSTKGNDYPSQLETLLQENTEQEVIVINRGRCAQNSSQVIEKLQEDLNSCNPDLVIMLFGMANSWNYYGYQVSDNYWERIRIVKLFRRISYNLKYKGASSDTRQNVEDYAFSFLIKSFDYPRFGRGADQYYYNVGRYFLALRDWGNSFRYLSFALSQDQYNTSCFSALKVCLQEYDKEKFFNSKTGLIDTTIVRESVVKLDNLILEFPDSYVFKVLKETYLFEKGYSELSRETLDFYRNSVSDSFNFNSVIFIEKNLNVGFDSLFNFYLSVRNVENAKQIDLTLAWLNISEKRFSEAKLLLENCNYNDNSSSSLYFAANYILALSGVKSVAFSFIENVKFPYAHYRELFDDSLSDEEFRLGIKQIFEHVIDQDKSENRMYFLPHNLKRTANVEQSGIFNWINSDISKAVEICLKQNHPVICMNYPLIPPPNSEEIHFWADSVGEIWKETAKKDGLLFVDNENIFKSQGVDQNLYFEPHKTGSEHCNDNGYKLIAQNILDAMRLEGYLNN